VTYGFDRLCASEDALVAFLADLDALTDPHDGWECLDKLRQVKRYLADVEIALENQLGDLLTGTTTHLGDVVLHRGKRTARTKWDTDDLLRAVLDTKRADENGEVIDETPLDKVLHCWNLPAPRLTAVRDRGLEPDEFCHREDRPGWTVRRA